MDYCPEELLSRVPESNAVAHAVNYDANFPTTIVIALCAQIFGTGYIYSVCKFVALSMF